MLLDAGVESADIGIVYLIRLYIATFAILAVLLTLIAAAPFTFALPYMFQVKHVGLQPPSHRVAVSFK